MQRGCFISIEGIEGAGKTTARDFIIACLEKANLPYLCTREPGGTKVAEEIRQLLLHLDFAESIQPETELLLMFAGRAQHIQHVIEPALHSGKWVISDRFIDATYAYQGGGRGMSIEQIKTLDKWVVKGGYPDLTLLLDLPAAVGLGRAEKRGSSKDRIEKEKIDFFDRVRQVYLLRAKEDSGRIKIVDANQSLQEVCDQITKVMFDFIKERKK